MTASTSQMRTAPLLQDVEKGVVAGLVGGAVFGVQMLLGGMMPMIASMIGSEDIVIGFVLHMIISAFIGGTFAVAAARLPGWLAAQVGAGVVYGIIWWVLGALIIMPLVLGMGEMVLAVGEMQFMSLIGHVIFGLVLGTTLFILNRVTE